MEDDELASDKGQKMIEKTTHFRLLFSLPSVELIVQTYHCGCWRGLPYGWWQGKLAVSSNHVLFESMVGEFQVDLKMREITGVETSSSLLLLDNGLEIQMHGGRKFFFGTFVSRGHRDEALVLIRHLVRHPVTLVCEQDLVNEEVDAAMERERARLSLHKDKKKVIREKVDVDSAQRAAATAIRTKELGQATLAELDRQRGVMEKVEKDLDRMDHNLVKAERHVRGVESVWGAFQNSVSDGPSFSQDDAAKKKEIAMVHTERMVRVPIVHKMRNDSLQFATLRFGAETFAVVDAGLEEPDVIHKRDQQQQEDKKHNKDDEWRYDQVDHMVVRSRPLHLDVIFSGNSVPRLRLCCAEIQAVVIELYQRTGKRAHSVVFEEGPMPRFAFAMERANIMPRLRRYRESTWKSFRDVSRGPSAFALAMEDEEVRDQLLQQDAALDQIEEVARDLQDMGKTIGKVAEEDQETLKRLAEKTDKTQHDVTRINARVERLL